MGPRDGEDRLTSAITVTSGRNSAEANPGAASSTAMARESSAMRGASAAARACASSVRSPRVPPGGVHAERACASVDVRLTYEFGKCSVQSETGPFSNQPQEWGYVAHKTP